MKVKVRKQEVSYVVHTTSSEGLKTRFRKVRAMSDKSGSITKEEVRRFLGSIQSTQLNNVNKSNK